MIGRRHRRASGLVGLLALVALAAAVGVPAVRRRRQRHSGSVGSVGSVALRVPEERPVRSPWPGPWSRGIAALVLVASVCVLVGVPMAAGADGPRDVGSLDAVEPPDPEPKPALTLENERPRTRIATVRPALNLPPITTRSARLEDVLQPRSAVPIGVRIPRLGVDTNVNPMGVEPSGALEVPAEGSKVAWYRHGVVPGDRGSAVLAGHVDYDGEEGVFRHLADLQPGDAVGVLLADGTERGFRVVARRQYPKAELPTDQLFAHGGPASLALVTCGGGFDADARSYRDNVVVYAVPAE